MWRSEPRSWLDRVVGACLGVLAGAVALYVAVRLVEAVAVALLIMAGVVVLAVAAFMFLRYRSRDW
jgi:hypothetical protein